MTRPAARLAPADKEGPRGGTGAAPAQAHAAQRSTASFCLPPASGTRPARQTRCPRRRARMQTSTRRETRRTSWQQQPRRQRPGPTAGQTAAGRRTRGRAWLCAGGVGVGAARRARVCLVVLGLYLSRERETPRKEKRNMEGLCEVGQSHALPLSLNLPRPPRGRDGAHPSHPAHS